VEAPRRAAVWLYGTAAAVLALDVVSKRLASAHLADGHPVALIPHVLDLRYTTNTGGAFGLLTGVPWLFALATVAVVGLIVRSSFRVSHRIPAVGMGLVLGGALGNLVSRLSGGLGLSGEVVDFIHLHLWPIFNVADASVVVGAAILVVVGLRGERKA
jgi:signal peptidase II